VSLSGSSPAVGDSIGVQELRRTWGWILALGIALIFLGMVAIGSPYVTSIFAVMALGWIWVISGVFQFFHGFWARRWSGFFLSLLGGILSIIVGMMMITHPDIAGLALTLLLAVFFVIAGVFRIAIAIALRYPSWVWGVLSGVINLAIGILIWSEFKREQLGAIEILGLFVGIDLLFHGWSYVMLAIAARQLPTTAS
jgi:uncharacterized membrane protein HdeD (DUF308 family)